MKNQNFKFALGGLMISLCLLLVTPVWADDLDTASTTPGDDASTTEKIIAPEPTIFTIPIKINYLDETIFDNTVTVTNTWFYDTNNNFYENASPTALGVLAAAGRAGNFDIKIVNGWGYYVSEISGHLASGFDGWIYHVNGVDPYKGMNDCAINQGDTMDVKYSVWEWKIGASMPTTTVNSPIIFTAYHYADGVWSPSPSTTISIAQTNFTTDATGAYTYTTSTTGTVKAYIFGTDSWPQNSPAINVEFLSPPAEPAPTPDGGSGGGSTVVNTPIDSTLIQTTADKILNYLKSQQDTTGEIIDGGISDWAIMAFASHGQYASAIKNGGASLLDFAKNYHPTAINEPNVCAGYSRHILALLATGIPANDSSITQLTAQIKSDCFSGGIFGKPGINDDVFGSIALLAAGENPNQEIITAIINTIKSDQTTDGAFTWGGYAGADITGAAVNALKYAQTKGVSIDENIFTRAKNYLKSTQLADGGWGYSNSDALTTGWAVMGIDALGENQNNWFNSASKNPWYILTGQIKNDGYYESAPGTIDWFATKHAVPALLGATWPMVLPPLSNAVPTTPGASDPLPTSTPTTTPVTTTTITTTTTPTTTEQIATTTTETILITAPTPTPEIKTPAPVKISANNFILKPKIAPTAEIKNDPNPPTQIDTSAEQLINQLPLDTPTRQTAKKILAVSGGGAATVGLYLGLKLLKNLL